MTTKHDYLPDGSHNWKMCSSCNKQMLKTNIKIAGEVNKEAGFANCGRCGEFKETKKHKWEDPTTGAVGLFDLCVDCIIRLDKP